jgi:hypothetical protein
LSMKVTIVSAKAVEQRSRMSRSARMTAIQEYTRRVRRLGPRIKRALASAGIRLNAGPTTRKRFSRRRESLAEIDKEMDRLLQLAESELEECKRLRRVSAKATRRGNVLNRRKPKPTKRQG